MDEKKRDDISFLCDFSNSKNQFKCFGYDSFFLLSHLFEPEKLSMLSSQKEIRILLSGQTVIVAKVK